MRSVIEWIDVEERLPEEDGEYIVLTTTTGRILMMTYVDGHWNCYRKSDGTVSTEFEFKNVEYWAVINDPREEIDNGE